MHLTIINGIILFVCGGIIAVYGSVVGGTTLLSLPLLIFLGMPTTLAIGTNRLGILILESTGAARFMKERRLPWRKGVWLTLVAGVGAFIGSRITVTISPAALNIATAVTILTSAIIILKKNSWGLTEDITRQKRLWLALLIIFPLSIYGGLSFGGGFGAYTMMLLLTQGYTFLESAGLSRMIGVAMSLVATVAFMFHGAVINYLVALVLGAGFIVGAWIGPGLAIKEGNRFVKYAFIAIVVATSIKLLYQVFH